MGNNAYKKEEAKKHNEYRAYEKEQTEARRLDMINNPEKYQRKRRVRNGTGGRISKAQMVMAIAAVS
tara:strand:+ start:360 stop:560 length:201 start_codon:yes stop_codon:yes gene_type:complete